MEAPPSDGSARDLANDFLASAGFLGGEGPRIVGLTEGTTCYVPPESFGEDDSMIEFVVHALHAHSTTASDV